MVLVALQDELLDTTHDELSTLHPNVTFRKVCIVTILLPFAHPPPQLAGLLGV